MISEYNFYPTFLSAIREIRDFKGYGISYMDYDNEHVCFFAISYLIKRNGFPYPNEVVYFTNPLKWKDLNVEKVFFIINEFLENNEDKTIYEPIENYTQLSLFK